MSQTCFVACNANLLSRDPSAVSAKALRCFFWPLLMNLIPHALEKSTNSFECFNLTVAVLRSAKRSPSSGIDLKQAVQHITDILLTKYHSTEVPALTLAPPRATGEANVHQTAHLVGAIDLGAFGLVTLLNRLLLDNSDQEILEVLPSG